MFNQDAIKKMTSVFTQQFEHTKGAVTAIAPGRVNLIGDHTDYNEGFVFPMTLDYGVYVMMRRRDDNHCCIYAMNFNSEARWQISSISKAYGSHWSNYVKGVMHVLMQHGYKLSGIDAVIYGDVPVGASLSSSAALEVALLHGLQKVFELNIDPIAAIKMAQQAENDFVGMRCGVMDQFVSRLGKSGHALFLDCRSLEYKNVPLKLNGHCLLLIDSKVQRELVNSAYNERRASCEEAVRYCQKLFPEVTALRDVNYAILQECKVKTSISSLTYRRARHVITENQRVLDAVAKLEEGDMHGFGALLYASHESLRDDYATSCAAIDCLVAAAQQSGALGARITGAGFGGCAIALVAQRDMARLQKGVSEAYARDFNMVPSFMPITSNSEIEILTA